LQPTKEIPLKRGFKIEKNSVIKLGRVRLRVRDIDSADKKPAAKLIKKQEKVKTLLTSTDKVAKPGSSPIDINEIELIDEAQARAMGVGVENKYRSNQDDKHEKKLHRTGEKKGELEAKDADRINPTKVSEESENQCRICWGTEEEDMKKSEFAEEFNPLISPCKCAGTMGMIHLKCLRGWLETKR